MTNCMTYCMTYYMAVKSNYFDIGRADSRDDNDENEILANPESSGAVNFGNNRDLTSPNMSDNTDQDQDSPVAKEENHTFFMGADAHKSISEIWSLVNQTQQSSSDDEHSIVVRFYPYFTNLSTQI